ncbi:MAG: hypothetical protein JXA83_16210, partial [Acidimicrobiales bacterium]|nr:hypothetical protein [Acidimicrobiales bacterium]
MMDAEERDLFAKSLQQATAQHTGAALDAALDDIGWRDALAGDAQAAVSTLFELQGAAGTTSSALDDVVVAALGVEAARDVAAVLPPLGAWAPAGAARDGDTLEVRGLGTAGMRTRHRAVVVARAGGGEVAAVVDTGALDLRTARGLDPRLGLVEVAGDRLPAAARTDLAPTTWQAAVAAGQRAVAHELVGASRAMLELARVHALERVQFG